MSSEDCVLSFRTSGPNYRTKQMASGDAQDLWVTSQQIGTQSLKESVLAIFASFDLDKYVRTCSIHTLSR